MNKRHAQINSEEKHHTAGDYYKFDLHVHTIYSKDALIKPSEIPKIVIRKGLNGIAITDHNEIKGAFALKKIIDRKSTDLLLVIGEEIRTNKGEVLALFIQEEVKSREFNEVIDEIRDQDGIAIAPHPFDTHRSSVASLYNELDGIEVFNSRCLSLKPNIEAISAYRENSRKKLMTAGSDAHFPFELGNAYVTSMSLDLLDEMRKRKIGFSGKLSPPIVHLLSSIRKVIPNELLLGVR